MIERDSSGIQAVQRKILAALRGGAVLTNCHKEGITKMYFERDRFVQSTEGDYSHREEYPDETKFLAAMWATHSWRVTGGTNPKLSPELDVWKGILGLIEGSGTKRPWVASASTAPSKPLPFVGGGHLRLPTIPTLIVTGALIVGTAIWAGVSRMLSVKTTGSPVGLAVGTPEFIAMLIRNQEPYVPTLHRNPNNDRFRIDLLLQPRDGKSPRRLISIARRLKQAESNRSAHVLGFDGKLFWLLSDDITAYDPAADRLIGLKELRKANPSLDELWPAAFYEVNGRLQASTRDNRTVVEIDPETLVAQPLNGRPARTRPFPPNPVDSLLIPTTSKAEGALNAAFVREGVDGPKLTLTQPDSALLTFWRKQDFLRRMLFVSRVDPSGKTLWETETGVGDLQQVLSDRSVVAFIGTRPRVPDKVPEPILTLIDNSTGAATSHSLWIRR
jgi:hypothetical protein